MKSLTGCILLLLSTCVIAEKALLSISATQRKEGELEFTIENQTADSIYFSNPKETDFGINFVATNARGNFSAFQKFGDDFWKHLVILTKRSEDMRYRWSWKFTVPVDKTFGRFEKLEVSGLWVATEEEFKKGTISSLKPIDFVVKIEK